MLSDRKYVKSELLFKKLTLCCFEPDRSIFLFVVRYFLAYLTHPHIRSLNVAFLFLGHVTYIKTRNVLIKSQHTSFSQESGFLTILEKYWLLKKSNHWGRREKIADISFCVQRVDICSKSFFKIGRLFPISTKCVTIPDRE